jgi:hypothetical protein
MKISEALYVAGHHLHTERQCHYNLRGFGINTISGPFEFKKMVHESSYIQNMLKHETQTINNPQSQMKRSFTHMLGNDT